MSEILITILQAFQLVALGPCLFIIAFLLLAAKQPTLVIVPVLYFSALSASFLLPLLPLFAFGDTKPTLSGLLFLESLTPALSFLLIIQFLYNRLPHWPFWFVLAIPLVGGSSFIYGSVYLDEVCLPGSSQCFGSTSLKSLYGLLSAALIFLLLVVHYSRTGQRISQHDTNRAHKYWLIMALIILNINLMIFDLAQLAKMVSTQDALFIATVLRIGFIYLVTTSLFRVFDRMFELDVEKLPTLSRRGRKPTDFSLVVEKILHAMDNDKLYREMRFSRDVMAQKLEVPEHQISKAINSHFEKNFNEFVNQYRVEEAKERLGNEETAVTTIAFEVGFNSIASFNRVFKDITGLAPTEFRTSTRQARSPAQAG